MVNSYLLEVVKALEPEQRQDVKQFLASPLFNSSYNAETIAHLFQLITDAAPDFHDESLKKETAYAKLFPGQPLVAGKLDKLMAELNILLKRYVLISKSISEEEFLWQQVQWSKWLREKGLLERSKTLITKLKNSRLAKSQESLELLREELSLHEEEHEWESLQNKFKGDLEIPSLVAQLDVYYHNYRTELINRYLIQQKAAQLPPVEVLESFSEDTLRNSALFKVAQKTQLLLKKETPTSEEFQELLTLIRQNEDTFTYETSSQYYSFLRSLCVILINVGNMGFVDILHHLHIECLEKGYMYVNGNISPNSFLNLVNIAIRAGKFDWGIEFTETHKNKIIGGDEGNFFYLLNLSQCYCAKGDYSKALQNLPDISSNFYYHQIVRRLELRVYYEMSSDLLLYKLDSFRKYIDRTAPKTLSPELRDMNLNFVKILLQLAQSPPKDKARSERLIARIQSKKMIAERAWLLEKARELG